MSRMMGDYLKIALVHDWLNQIGGAEDVLEALKRSLSRQPHLHQHLRRDRSCPLTIRNGIFARFGSDRLPGNTSGVTKPICPFIHLAWQ